ncbi:MAG: methyltransferase [Pseudomonadota bacterium]
MGWYTGNGIYDTVLIAAFVFAGFITFNGAFGRRDAASYGRFGRDKGVALNPKAGWILMELPALLLFPVFFFAGSRWMEPVPMFIGALWMFHYLNRAIITPSLMRVHPNAKKSFGIEIMIGGWIALAFNAYLNGYFASELGTHLHSVSWFSDPRFIIGLAIYALGFTINFWSDSILRNLRPKTPTADTPQYSVPTGGLFKYVSSPQYFGEILSFTGLSILTWGLGFVYILIVTAGNLIPRAIETHKWYKNKFADYPADRKIIFPGVL